MVYINIINTLLHHPIHPMLVHFPIGLTGGALFFIVLALIWPKVIVFEKIAFGNLALSVLAVPVAGIVGFLDNLHRYSGKAANHNYKIAFAITLFIVVAVTSYVRWRNPDLFERKSSKWYYAGAILVAFAIAAILGFLGGIIVFGSS